MLALLVGLFPLLAGFLKLGRLMRFVSNAVIVGFMTGISVLIVLSQLGDFSGFASNYSNKVLMAFDLFLNLRLVQPQTLVIGLLTILTVLVLDRTRLRPVSMLIAMLLASGAVFLFDWAAVQLVGDVADIPQSFPGLKFPDFSRLQGLILPAFSLTIISLVQGAGVSKAYPNTDGRYPNLSSDFRGQGAANIVASLFQGMPIGGSVSTTALNVRAGARTRWANIFSGLFIVVVVLLFSRAVSLAAMPAMAALLIVAGFQSINVNEFMDVWDVGWGPRGVMLVTFLTTMVMPIQYAVFAGVLLSGIVYIVTSSRDVRLMEIVPLEDGLYREIIAPDNLQSRKVTVLHILGSLFFASADRVEGLFPDPQNAQSPVVVLRLRQSNRISSTFIKVLERYEALLKAQGGKLILAGVNDLIKEQLDRTETTIDVLGSENVFLQTDILGESTQKAVKAAEEWLEQV